MKTAAQATSAPAPQPHPSPKPEPPISSATSGRPVPPSVQQSAARPKPQTPISVAHSRSLSAYDIGMGISNVLFAFASFLPWVNVNVGLAQRDFTLLNLGDIANMGASVFGITSQGVSRMALFAFAMVIAMIACNVIDAIRSFMKKGGLCIAGYISSIICAMIAISYLMLVNSTIESSTSNQYLGSVLSNIISATLWPWLLIVAGIVLIIVRVKFRPTTQKPGDLGVASAAYYLSEKKADAGRAAKKLALKGKLTEIQNHQQAYEAELGAALYETTKEDAALRGAHGEIYDNIAACIEESKAIQKEIDELEGSRASNTQTCPHCHKEIMTGTVYCAYCGKHIEEEIVEQSAVVEEAPVEPVCSSCGTSNIAGSTFCKNCGSRL